MKKRKGGGLMTRSTAGFACNYQPLAFEQVLLSENSHPAQFHQLCGVNISNRAKRVGHDRGSGVPQGVSCDQILERKENFLLSLWIKISDFFIQSLEKGHLAVSDTRLRISCKTNTNIKLGVVKALCLGCPYGHYNDPQWEIAQVRILQCSSSIFLRFFQTISPFFFCRRFFNTKKYPLEMLTNAQTL